MRQDSERLCLYRALWLCLDVFEVSFENYIFQPLIAIRLFPFQTLIRSYERSSVETLDNRDFLKWNRLNLPI